MAPPSQLAIASSSLQRLVKEEISYHKELVAQKARLEKLQVAADDEEGNKEWELKQQRTAIAETEAVFEPVRLRIEDALHKLEDQLAKADGASAEEVAKAEDAIKQAKETLAQK